MELNIVINRSETQQFQVEDAVLKKLFNEKDLEDLKVFSDNSRNFKITDCTEWVIHPNQGIWNPETGAALYGVSPGVVAHYQGRVLQLGHYQLGGEKASKTMICEIIMNALKTRIVEMKPVPPKGIGRQGATYIFLTNGLAWPADEESAQLIQEKIENSRTRA